MSNKKKNNIIVLIPSRGLLITQMVQALLDELRECPYVGKYEILFSDGMTVDKA